MNTTESKNSDRTTQRRSVESNDESNDESKNSDRTTQRRSVESNDESNDESNVESRNSDRTTQRRSVESNDESKNVESNVESRNSDRTTQRRSVESKNVESNVESKNSDRTTQRRSVESNDESKNSDRTTQRRSVESNDESKTELHNDDLYVIPNAELIYRGICSDHINSGNDFIEKGVSQIMTKTFVIERTIINERDATSEDKGIDTINVRVIIKSVNMKKPMTTHYASSREEMLTPKMALMEDRTYASPLHADIDVVAVAHLKDGGTVERKASVDQLLISTMPIMVRSKLCHTYGKTYETLLNMNEDPGDHGGYFIIKGIEWVINNIESTPFNVPKIFKNVGHRNELARLEMISKPGDSYENSSQIYVKMLTGNQLVVIIDRAPLSEVQIPFYILFRLIGWQSDRQIVDWIVYNHESKISEHMLEILRLAFKARYLNFGEVSHIYSMDDILKMLVVRMPTTYSHFNLSDEKTIQYVNNRVLRDVDTYLFPHIGMTNAFRHEKAKYLAYLIRQLFLVDMQVIAETDRDSLKNKRMHSAGMSFAKAFKQQFNFVIVQPIKKQFLRDFKSTAFSKVDLAQSLKTAVNSMDFERSMSQAITTGKKQQISLKKGRKMINRLTSQQLHRKNQLNYISTLRQINSPNSSKQSSKQSNRANEMRRVHPSYTGYVCPIQTQEGESVGLNKQLALSASITPGSSGVLLKELLTSDEELVLLSNVSPALLASGVANVKVNGHWIGCVDRAYYFVDKYRELRRQGKIHPMTTIVWNSVINEVLFWVDTGRLIRPLLVVYNNYGNHYTKHKILSELYPDSKDPESDRLREYPREEDFKQWITLTNDHLVKLRRGEISITDLSDQGVIEYITPDEQENMLLSIDYDCLQKNKNNPLMRYTHCDIPAALVGLVCLMSPLATHSPTARTILATAQAKQSCGWFSLAWPFRIDKESFLQYHCEMPLVRTLGNDHAQPNGVNIVLAIAVYNGYNQEDSLILNKGAIQRGLFDGVHFTFERTELEKNEFFGNPDVTTTSDIKPYASYEKIYDGFPKKGTILKKNDVIIGKLLKYARPEEKFKYADKSKIYKHDEPATVFNVIVGRNQEGKSFAKVQLMIVRECSIGDKFCLDELHEVLTVEDGWLSIKNVSSYHHIMTLDPSTGNIEYNKVLEKFVFPHNGCMYNIKTDTLDLCTTLNHNMYVKTGHSGFMLKQVKDVIGYGTVYYKKNANNPDVHQFIYEIGDHKYDMNNWLKLLGMFLNCGIVPGRNESSRVPKSKYIFIPIFGRKGASFKQVLLDLKIRHISSTSEIFITDEVIVGHMEQLVPFACIPAFVWKLSMVQSRILLLSILDSTDDLEICTRYSKISDDLQHLILRCGWSADKRTSDTKPTMYYLYINKGGANEPIVGSYGDYKTEKITHMSGNVYCVDVKNHIFMTRRNGCVVWTGNSMRSGQKGVAGILLDEEDMPMTSSGIVPDFIFNPHSMPSRMTIGTPIEMILAKICAILGIVTDGTIFKKINIKELRERLVTLGYSSSGCERLYNGMTGKWIDTEIFIGPAYYQRLQKFVNETIYAVSYGSTDALTRQPLEGKSVNGSLRIGEMEKDVLLCNGTSRFLSEKFYDHSDGFKVYICRGCGKYSVVNNKLLRYKCATCGGDADITEVDSSWSSKLFMQELHSMNIGVQYSLTPFEYESYEGGHNL
jgi:DNA-directed RNA polymerase II subunit RPB2